ncbi:DUF1684 domain-containing protein [Rhizobium sp.]|uniref:DUF1684 domain-containing protein n=1 Tax=Rhizobium sp. TaxID=391 RepID=UPI000DDA3F09
MILRCVLTRRRDALGLAAITAIDQALWNITRKAAGLPVDVLLIRHGLSKYERLDPDKSSDLGNVPPDGTLLLDFNFSYFPSCAYSSRYVCPLSPSASALKGALRAGEGHR